MFISPRLQKAIDFMKAGHLGQTRKDGIRPYSVHPLEVHSRVMKVTTDEEIGFAALFHDLEEHIQEGVLPAHPEYGLSAISRDFGKRVADFVLELSDEFTKVRYPELNRKARKQRERERYGAMSAEARLIKIADISTNLNDDGAVLEDGKPEVGFQQMFIREKSLCLPYLAMDVSESEHSLYRANAKLYAEAAQILRVQKIKFDVKG